MPEISDERLDEILAWAQREQTEFAADGMPVSAQHHADLATLIAEVKVARAGKGVGEVWPVAIDTVKGAKINRPSQFRLWFFRDLTDEQRLQLFSLAGLPAEEIHTHVHQRMAIDKIMKDLTPALPSLEPQGAQEAVAWACVKCNSPRAVDPCPKCGTPLTKPADGWDWPRLPDIDHIRKLAREVGYAIGVHGSLERDLDLIAAPWVADAVEPMALAQHIAAGLGGEVIDYKNQDKPCGRWSCNIHTPDWTKMIDLSVMPPQPTGNSEHGGVSEEAVEAAARAMCLNGGFDPDERMPNDGPRWRYYASGARAALTAASGQQGKGVKALNTASDHKPLALRPIHLRLLERGESGTWIWLADDAGIHTAEVVALGELSRAGLVEHAKGPFPPGPPSPKPYVITDAGRLALAEEKR